MSVCSGGNKGPRRRAKSGMLSPFKSYDVRVDGEVTFPRPKNRIVHAAAYARKDLRANILRSKREARKTVIFLIWSDTLR